MERRERVVPMERRAQPVEMVAEARKAPVQEEPAAQVHVVQVEERADRL